MKYTTMLHDTGNKSTHYHIHVTACDR